MIILTADDVKQRFGPLFVFVLCGNRGIEAAGLYGEYL